jgi:hypothetical protein
MILALTAVALITVMVAATRRPEPKRVRIEDGDRAARR